MVGNGDDNKGFSLQYCRLKKRCEMLTLKEMAKQGDIEAQYELGKCYMFGIGIHIDYIKAKRWFRVAAKQGHAGAQFHYGYYYSGGSERNLSRSAKWYSRAAA